MHRWSTGLRGGLFFGIAAWFFAGTSAWAGDPTGAETLKSGEGIPVTYVWVLMSAFLVMFMQAGFACVEAGFCRAKNTTNLFTKNVMDFVVGALSFWALGYAFMMGDSAGGLIGLSGFFLGGDGYDVGNYLTFFWMMVFAATAATIVSGAVAERLKFQAYLCYSIGITMLIYPVYGHWVWGGGWLSTIPFGLGHLDFAGSGVVHAVGGFIGLAGAMVLGPRYGKYDKDGKPRVIPGHSLPMAALGTFILWFGWYGFNPGSTFDATHLRIAVIAVNTTLAASAGSITALLIILAKTKRYDLGMGLNGALAGLVAITAPCAWVNAWSSVVIGVVAGFVVVYGVFLLDNLKIDDPVGAIPVHGFNGVWGLLAVGIFADGTYGNYSIEAPFVQGLLFGGGADQLIAQAIGAFVVAAWSLGTGLVLFKILDAVIGIRVDPREEIQGLDILEHGTPAYPEFYAIRG